jgi:hypothetical protein
MAIGRVPGAALLGNLDRQGLDLGFTTNSTTLLQLDFTNYRLGINTAAPQQALDVTGNILVTTGNVYTSTDLTYDIGAVSARWKNIYTGNINSTNIAGTITTAAQTSITSIGTLSELTVSGNIIAQSSVVPTSNIAGNIGYTDKWWSAVYANTINASNINGTILTANQPNITNLSNITVDSISVGGNVVIGGNINGATITADAFIQNGHAVLDTITTINITGDVTGSGNVSNIALTLANTGVVAGVYGSADDEYADRIPKITVDSKGRITNIANVTLTQVGNVTFTDTTISTTSSLTLNSANNGNIILNADGTGTVQFIGNDAVGLPHGNTAVRPTNVHAGYLRYNTDLFTIEYYTGSQWENNLNIAGTLSSEVINPTGLTNSYTLLDVATTDGVLVSINGTLQQPSTSYTVAGNIITFTETPLSSDIIEIRAITMNLISVPVISDGPVRVEADALTGNVTVTGNIVPIANVTYDLGSPTMWWRDVYMSGTTLHIGGAAISVIDNTLNFTPSGSSTPVNLSTDINPSLLYAANSNVIVTSTHVNVAIDSSNIASFASTGLAISGNVSATNFNYSNGVSIIDSVNGSIATLTSNAAVQSGQIATIQSTYASLSGATFSGALSAPSLTLSSTALAITSGGTGGTSTAEALNNLLPSGETSGYVLKTSGPGSYYWSAETGASSTLGTQIATSRTFFTATSNQTVFTGVGTYTIGASQLRIYINGVRQFNSAYTETSTTSFTLSTGVATGTVLLAEVDGYTDFTSYASDVVVSPIGSVSATTVQNAIAELDTEKASLSGATFTGNISVPYITGATTVTGNLTVGGNLNVLGNVTTFNSNNVTIQDALIYLADDNGADVLDIGFVSSFTNSGYQHTGLARDATDGTWKLFANVVAEPTTTIDFTNATYSNLKIGLLTTTGVTSTGPVSTGNLTAGNTSITGTMSQDGVTGGIVPVGGIIMWSGSIISIPARWALCDGTNSTPNLRDRFIVGAGSTYAVNATGGTADAIIVYHDHSVAATFTGTALATHGHTASSVVTDPGHYHTSTLYNLNDFNQGGASYQGAEALGDDQQGTFSFNTDSKTTGITVTTSISSNSAGTPAGTISASANTTGSSGTNANLPPYYALAYIMRTS